MLGASMFRRLRRPMRNLELDGKQAQPGFDSNQIAIIVVEN
jgi:hypothetical protein